MNLNYKYLIGIIAAIAVAALAVNLIFFDKGPSTGFKASANVVEVTDKNFEQEVLNSKIPVVIDFNADWCQPCKTYKPVFHKVADQYAGKVKFVSINVDNAPAVANLFGVQAIPATVFLSETNNIISAGAVSGALNEETLKKFLDFCLQPGAKLIPLFEKRDPNAPKPNDPNAQPAPKGDGTQVAPSPTVDPNTTPAPGPKAEPAVDPFAPKPNGEPSIVDPLPAPKNEPKPIDTES